MKKLSKETAFNLKTGFGTLISNQSCIEAGRSLPKWIAVILGLIGTFIPVIPVMVNIAKTNGETFISGDNIYNFDRDAALVNIKMKNEGKEFIVGDDHLLTYYENDSSQNGTGSRKISEYVNPLTGQYEMLVYWLEDNLEANVNDQYTKLTSSKYIINTIYEASDGDPESIQYYVPSIIAYYREGNALYLAKANSTNSVSKFSGDFKNVKAGTKIIDSLTSVEGMKTPTGEKDISPEYIAAVYDKYKAFYNDSYQDIKTKSLIYSTFIYWGIYVGLTLFLGLLIFILTRGKKNFNNYLKWYECLSISAWASFTPGLLAMILGFLMTSYAIMFFILLMGVRIMWLSMKQLSPRYQAQ